MNAYEQLNRAMTGVGSLGGLGSGIVSQAQKAGQIPLGIGILQERVESLEKMIVELNQRLGSVLIASCPTPCPDKTQSEESLVQVADQIRQITRRIELARETLKDIIGRIEL